jgi:hypothetical protein
MRKNEATKKQKIPYENVSVSSYVRPA